MDKVKRNIQLSLYFFIITIVSFYLSLRNIPSQIDDINYLNYAIYGGQLFFANITNYSSYIVDEPLWLFINYLLGLMFDPIVVIRIIIFTSVFLTLLIVGKFTRYSFLGILFYVLIDQLLKNNVIHIRQGLALSFLLLGLLLKGRWRFFLILSPLIHTSFWFVIVFYLYDKFLKRYSLYFKVLLFSLFSIIMVIFLPFIASFLGDRRASLYEFSTIEGISGIAFLWWILFFIVYLIGVTKNEISKLSIYGLLFYLITYFSLDFSARIFENFLILILISCINSKSLWKYLLLILLLIYALFTAFPSIPMVFRIY